MNGTPFTCRIGRIASLALLATSAFIGGCIEHRVKADPVEVKPIKVEPIQITVDVNVRVDRRLDEFFKFQDEMDAQGQPEAR